MQSDHQADLANLAREVKSASVVVAELASRLQELSARWSSATNFPGNSKKHLGASEIEEVRKLRDSGLNHAAIAKARGCSPRHAGNLLHALDYSADLIRRIGSNIISLEEVKRRRRVMSDQKLVQYVDAIARWRTDQEQRGTSFRKERNHVTAAIIMAYNQAHE